jgi:hypothetical protein
MVAIRPLNRAENTDPFPIRKGGPLSFRHNGGMTEVLPAFEWADFRQSGCGPDLNVPDWGVVPSKMCVPET